MNTLLQLTHNFVKQTDAVFKTRNPATTLKHLPAKDGRWLRALDNICFLSTCLLLQCQATGNCVKQKELLVVARANVQQSVLALAEAHLLFVPEADATPTFFITPCFVTYEAFQPERWQLHLVAGIFLLFWRECS